eukprot:scaffold16252_cov54-Phaeocystis_antarctica.AAC.1
MDGPRVLAPRGRHALAQLRRRRHHSARRARGCMPAMPVIPTGRLRPVLSMPQLTLRPSEHDRAQVGPNAFEQIRPDALSLDRLPWPFLLALRRAVSRPAALLHLVALFTCGALRDVPAW